MTINEDDTYIRMPPDLLNGLLIEVTGIAKEAAADVVGVLEASEGIVHRVEETPLAELKSLILTLAVDFLDPHLVVCSRLVVDMLLELDDVGVGDCLGVGR